MIATLAQKRSKTATLNLAVVACSNGAEVYSILWTIRSAYPDINVKAQAIDIADAVIQIAKGGRYSLTHSEMMDTPMFERLSEEEIRQMFDKDGDTVSIKQWIKEGIEWRVADANDPDLVTSLGLQDIVVANRFLCHMNPAEAETCLRNLGHFVAPGGYLFVSGIDLDIRTKVASELGWSPVTDSMEEIHNGDISVRKGWPLHYWGLEPFTKSRSDWNIRYASVFQIGSPMEVVKTEQSQEMTIA